MKHWRIKWLLKTSNKVGHMDSLFIIILLLNICYSQKTIVGDKNFWVQYLMFWSYYMLRVKEYFPVIKSSNAFI